MTPPMFACMMSSPHAPGIQADQGQPQASSGPQKNSNMADPSCPISTCSPVTSLERRLVTGSLERGHLTSVLFSPSSVLCILSFAQTCEHLNSAGFHTRLMSESTAGKNTMEQPASTLCFWQFDGSPNCLLIRWSFGSFGFLILKFHTANFPRKGSNPPSPTLSSEPSERKPPHHHTPRGGSGYALVLQLSNSVSQGYSPG